ncbi:MAG: hypothetical protein OXF56_24640 [Rhodobacteraceae bacterium]|nr:hypothetical protein [Paracoccaceae bacterium]
MTAFSERLALVEEVRQAFPGLPVAIDPFLKGHVSELALVFEHALKPPQI